jgi:hypothetical protein
MKEPYPSQFRALVQAGAGNLDIHEGKELVGYAVASLSASEDWVSHAPSSLRRVSDHGARPSSSRVDCNF